MPSGLRQITTKMESGKKIYFASDQHLGAPDYESSLRREKLFVKWLDEVAQDADEIYLLGDLFDFWFEYKKAVPRGFVRVLGKLAQITDSGIPVHFFTGNHDMWVFDYLPKETGVQVLRNPIERQLNGKTFLIGHGDGLGPGDRGYKIIKKVFRNKICQRLFGFLHPSIGIGLADYFSRSSRAATGNNDKNYNGPENEWLLKYCRKKLREKHYDYFIFGHRHLPLKLNAGENSIYFNTGDWISDFTYLIFDGKNVQLMEYTQGKSAPHSPK